MHQAPPSHNMFAVVNIPNFSLQAVLRHEPALCAQPVALVDTELVKPEIVQLTAAAKNCGVVAGSTPSQAMARCRQLQVKVCSPEKERSATEILLQTAYAYSPNIEATRLGVCTLELKRLGMTNPTALEAWSKKILQALAQFHLEAKMGVGPTPDLALIAAQGSDSIAILQDAGEFISGLPVAALVPPREVLEVLSRWGIQTAGEFLALGRHEIAERLGADALELFKRVSPDSVRPLKLVLPPEEFSEHMNFEGEIETVEPLLLALRRLVKLLTDRLEAIYLVVEQLQLCLGLASGAKLGRIFKIPSPTGDAEVLFRALQTYLETVRTDSPVVSVQLAAMPARPDNHQFGLFQNTLRNPNRFAETLARLNALVGSENVGTPVLAATHKPDSFRMQPPNFDFISASNTRRETQTDGSQLRRFRPPLPAEFEFSENKPAHLYCKMIHGAIIGFRGPYLSSGNWWDAQHWAREEWDVEMETGVLLRIVRSNNGGFVEGVYD